MVVTPILHKLVFIARLFMKKASWAYCVLVFNSFGEPAAHPAISDSCSAGGSGTEFEFGRTISCEDDADAIINAPMDDESSMN